MKENIIKTKSYEFALRIIKLYQYLQDKKEFVMSKQLLRSGTSIGANIRESEDAESKADFIHKMSIALKEANETDYWIDLLRYSGYIDAKQFDSISSDAKEILSILVKIVKSSQVKIKSNKKRLTLERLAVFHFQFSIFHLINIPESKTDLARVQSY